MGKENRKPFTSGHLLSMLAFNEPQKIAAWKSFQSQIRLLNHISKLSCITAVSCGTSQLDFWMSSSFYPFLFFSSQSYFYNKGTVSRVGTTVIKTLLGLYHTLLQVENPVCWMQKHVVNKKKSKHPHSWKMSEGQECWQSWHFLQWTVLNLSESPGLCCLWDRWEDQHDFHLC